MQDAQHDQAHLFLRHDKVNFFILMDFLMNYCFPSMVYVYMLTGNPPITRKVVKENEVYAIFLVIKFSSAVDCPC